MTETHVFHCWSPMNSTVRTVHITSDARLVKPGSLVSAEVTIILGGLWHRQKYVASNSPLAHACRFLCHSPSLHI